jgi:arylsulfatase A-like enzyme
MTDDIGEFLEALLKRQGWKDTLLVFVSDHGEGLGDHPNVARSKNHGTLMYESQAMVPWIMYQASWTPHVSRVKRDVRLMDVMPTLLDHLGVAGPEDMDGISVKPLIDGFDELPELPRYKVLETYFRTEKISVYADEYAYIFSPVSHIGIDKRELQARGGKENGIRTNAIEDHPKVAEELKAFLVEWKETHKKAQPTASKRGISKDEEAQLQAIGYL